jgi:membrane-associated phospholipid phosphatase
MRKSLAMSLVGLAAIVLDYLVVTATVGLLLLTRWVGVGWILDVVTAVLVGCVVIAWFYGKRFSKFLSSERDEKARASVYGAASGGPDFHQPV